MLATHGARNWLPAVAICLFSVSSAAQSQPAKVPVLDADATEEQLIEALAIAPDASKKCPPLPPEACRGLIAIKPNVLKPFSQGKAHLLVTFLTDSTVLTPEAERFLDKLAVSMKHSTVGGQDFRVIGHADARGSATRNQQLSSERAKAVAAYLIEKHGILEARLHPQGRGANEPLDAQRVDSPLNRRVSLEGFWAKN